LYGIDKPCGSIRHAAGPPAPPTGRMIAELPGEHFGSSGESHSQEIMQTPNVLLIEKREEGFFLFRFTADGIPVSSGSIDPR
jgi:hypothetical protein